MKPVRTLTAALILAGGAVVFSAAPAYAAIIPTDPPEGASDQVCEELDSTKIEDLGGAHQTFEITADPGYVITGFCVKAGSGEQEEGPEYYLVDPPQASVIISHSSGKDISHYSFTQEPVPTPTPTPTQPPAGGGGGDKLAETGFEAGWLPLAGIGALAIGAALVAPRLAAKRR